MKALIIGGTKGIGLALKHKLESSSWTVVATGRADFDIGKPESYWYWIKENNEKFDLVVFAAGILDPEQWDKKTWGDYLYSYQVHALGPVYFLAHFNKLIANDATIVFMGSTGAHNTGIVDLSYGMSKAALYKAALALAVHTDWRIHLMNFDLVDTDMMRKNPKDTLGNREVISAEQAALEIMKCLEE